MLRCAEHHAERAWPGAAWHVACEVSVGVVEGVVSGDVDACVARAMHAARVESERVALAVLRSAGSYVAALRAATTSNRRLFAAMHATVALYRLALYQELCSASYGTVSYRGAPLATGRLVTARTVRAFAETTHALGVPCAVCVLMHNEGGLVVLSVAPEPRGLDGLDGLDGLAGLGGLGALVVGAVVEERAALTAMTAWTTSECVGERATLRSATVFALHADEEQLVAVETDEHSFALLHAVFLAEHTLAVRVVRGVVVAAVHTARAAHTHSSVGMELDSALRDGKWLSEPCVSRSYDAGANARVVLVTLCRVAWL